MTYAPAPHPVILIRQLAEKNLVFQALKPRDPSLTVQDDVKRVSPKN